MISGGIYSRRPNSADPAAMDSFVKALSGYRATGNGFNKLEEAAHLLGLSFEELKQASNNLGALNQTGSGLGIKRFAKSAPNLYPDPSKVWAYGLMLLEKMDKGRAEKLGADLIHQLAKDIPIEGKYVG